MTKIHITLVGGQPSPVYNGILSNMPEKVIFVCSNDSEDIAKRIKDNIQLESDIIGGVPPSDMEAINKTASDLFNKYKEDEVSLNLTGGAKLWMLLFYNVFIKNEKAYLFYIDQNNLEWDLKTATNKKISFDPDKLFELQGTPLRHYRPISVYNDEDDDVIRQIERARKFAPHSFKTLTTVLEEGWERQLINNEEGEFKRKGSFVKWNKKTEEVELQLESGYQTFHHTYSSPNIINLVFNTGWFEYKVASLFKSHYNDIRLNCLFDSKDNLTKNEVDIIVNTGDKLIFVECKTNLSKITDIDKFHSVVKNYGGTGSKGLVFTLVPMNDAALEKCKDNDMITFCWAEHKNVKEDLFKLLDKEIKKINKR